VLSVEADLYNYTTGMLAQQHHHEQFNGGNSSSFEAQAMLYPYCTNKFHRLVVYHVCDRFGLSHALVDPGDGTTVMSVKLGKRGGIPHVLLLNFLQMFPEYFAFEDTAYNPKVSPTYASSGSSGMHHNDIQLNHNTNSGGDRGIAPPSTNTDEPVAIGSTIDDANNMQEAVSGTVGAGKDEGGKGIQRIIQRPQAANTKLTQEASEEDSSHDMAATTQTEEEVEEARIRDYELKKQAIFGNYNSNDTDGDIASEVTAENNNTNSSGKSIRTNRDQEQSDPDFQAGRAQGRGRGQTPWNNNGSYSPIFGGKSFNNRVGGRGGGGGGRGRGVARSPRSGGRGGYRDTSGYSMDHNQMQQQQHHQQQQYYSGEEMYTQQGSPMAQVAAPYMQQVIYSAQPYNTMQSWPPQPVSYIVASTEDAATVGQQQVYSPQILAPVTIASGSPGPMVVPQQLLGVAQQQPAADGAPVTHFAQPQV
jgi:hypothetical protein